MAEGVSSVDKLLWSVQGVDPRL